MVNQGETNASANVESDIMAPRVPVSARKKSVEVGSTNNISREKHKISEVDSLNAVSPSSASQDKAETSTSTKKLQKGKNSHPTLATEDGAI